MPKAKKLAAEPSAEEISRFEDDGGVMRPTEGQKTADVIVLGPYGRTPRADGRMYGPDDSDPEPEQDTGIGVRGVNIAAMNEAQLRTFAMQHFGTRFQEKETREHMLRDMQSRMSVGRYARYR